MFSEETKENLKLFAQISAFYVVMLTFAYVVMNQMKIGDLVRYKGRDRAGEVDYQKRLTARKGYGLITEILQGHEPPSFPLILKVQWSGIIQVTLIEMAEDLELVKKDG